MTLIKTNKSHEANLELKSDDNMWTFNVRFDGCVHIEKFDSGIREDGREYLHICDIPAFISIMQEVLKMARQHFGENFE